MSVRAQKLKKWSSFSHRFGYRSELLFIFELLRCAHFLHDIFYFWHTASGCSWRLHFVPISTCWMNVFKFKIRQTCISKVIVFCVTPIVPESFMIISSINVLVQLFLMVGGFGGRSYHLVQNFFHQPYVWYMTCILLGESLDTTIKNTALLWTWNSNPAGMCVCVWLKKLLLKRMLLEQRPVAIKGTLNWDPKLGTSQLAMKVEKNQFQWTRARNVIPIFIIHLNPPNLGPVQQPSARDSVPFLSYYQGKLVPGNFRQGARWDSTRTFFGVDFKKMIQTNP